MDEMDEDVTPTKDVLLAISSGLRGDRTGVRVLIANARDRVEKRVRRELRSLERRKTVSTTKKLKICGARLAPPQRLPAMAPPGAIETMLPNGRKARLILVPAAARHQDVLVLRRVNRANTKRAFAAIIHNGRAIDQLAASQRDLAERLTKLQANGDLALLHGIVEGLTKLERRVAGVKQIQDKTLAAQKYSVNKKLMHQRRALATQTRAAQMQKLHSVVASMQSAAYGTRGSLLATNNLLLAANQLGWSFVPQIVETLGLVKPGATNPWAWLAPLGSLVTSRIVLGRRQHERFVSGVVTEFFSPSPPLGVTFAVAVGSRVGVATLSLKQHIAAAEWENFAKRTAVPVTTMVLAPSGAREARISSIGEVHGGTLTVRIEAFGHLLIPPGVIVSWTVDTQRPDG